MLCTPAGGAPAPTPAGGAPPAPPAPAPAPTHAAHLSECEALGCSVYQGGDWNNWESSCSPNQAAAPIVPDMAACASYDRDSCTGLCEFQGNGGIIPSMERVENGITMGPGCGQLVAASFTADGTTFTCGTHPTAASDPTQCSEMSSWATTAAGFSKCASVSFASYSANLLVGQTPGAQCARYTTVALNGVLQPWDGLTSDGSSVFALKTTASLIPASMMPLDDTWFTSTCDGLFIGRVSETLMGAIQVPTLFPIFEHFADVYRSVVLSDATITGECITDEQVQSFFTPWSVQYWLTAVSTWGPTAADTPPLAPALASPGVQMMQEVFDESRDDSDCPVTCDASSGSCNPSWADGGSCDPSYQDPIEECGWTMDTTANMTDGSPCLGEGSYPRLALPTTCTAAGYSASPSTGCAANYDMSWATDGEALSMDLALAKCTHNPLSLSAVSLKCVDDDTTNLCNYGRDWCTDDATDNAPATTPCTDPAKTCVPFPADLLDPAMFDESTDIVSALMGTEEVGGFVNIASDMDEYTNSQVTMWQVLSGPASGLADAANQRPDLFNATGALSSTAFITSPMDVGQALVDSAGMTLLNDNVLGMDRTDGDAGNSVCQGAPDEAYVSIMTIPVGTYYDSAASTYAWVQYPQDMWDQDCNGGDGCQVNLYYSIFTPTPADTAGDAPCTYSANTKVAAGYQQLEAINFVREQFGNTAYAAMPADLGYCAPLDSVLLQEAEEEAGVDTCTDCGGWGCRDCDCSVPADADCDLPPSPDQLPGCVIYGSAPAMPATGCNDNCTGLAYVAAAGVCTGCMSDGMTVYDVTNVGMDAEMCGVAPVAPPPPPLEDQLITFDETNQILGIVGLGSTPMPATLGDSSLSSVSMTPPFGQETCGLVTVTQVVVPATVSLPGMVSTADLTAALASTAPAGSTVAITSQVTTVSSTFELPAGTELDSDARDALREAIAAQYGVPASQIDLGGVRRRALAVSEARRRLQVAVTYTMTSSDPDQVLLTPDTAGMTGAITAGAGVAPASVADPTTATVAVAVEYTITVTQSAGTDASATIASATDTSALGAALDGQISDASGTTMSAAAITAGTTATTETPLVVAVTTTADAAATAGVTAAAAVATPVACSGSWATSWGDCTVTCGGGTQVRAYTIIADALNGGAACSAVDGASETQACNAGACAAPPTPTPSTPAPSPTTTPASPSPPAPSPGSSGASSAYAGATLAALAVINFMC